MNKIVRLGKLGCRGCVQVQCRAAFFSARLKSHALARVCSLPFEFPSFPAALVAGASRGLDRQLGRLRMLAIRGREYGGEGGCLVRRVLSLSPRAQPRLRVLLPLLAFSARLGSVAGHKACKKNARFATPWSKKRIAPVTSEKEKIICTLIFVSCGGLEPSLLVVLALRDGVSQGLAVLDGFPKL